MRPWWAIVCAVAVLVASTQADARRRRRPRKGGLEIVCSVQGAEVFINGELVGKTPIRPQALSVGSYDVTVKKLGFLDYTEKVPIRAAKTSEVVADLLPFAGVIRVTANAPDAKVAVDGTWWGKVPLEREVTLGKHTITVSAPGFVPHIESISADPGIVYAIDAELAAAISEASSVAEADETGIDGEELALAPLPIAPTPPSEEDGLELTALAPMPLAGGSAPPADPVRVQTEVEPAKPWYFEWWAIASASAVVAAGTTLAVLLLRKSECEVVDMWQLGTPNYQQVCIPK